MFSKNIKIKKTRARGRLAGRCKGQAPGLQPNLLRLASQACRWPEAGRRVSRGQPSTFGNRRPSLHVHFFLTFIFFETNQVGELPIILKRKK